MLISMSKQHCNSLTMKCSPCKRPKQSTHTTDEQTQILSQILWNKLHNLHCQQRHVAVSLLVREREIERFVDRGDPDSKHTDQLGRRPASVSRAVPIGPQDLRDWALSRGLKPAFISRGHNVIKGCN